MARKKYPRWSSISRPLSPRTSLSCELCNKQAEVKTFIEVWHMRGDDERVVLCKSCMKSKTQDDLDYIVRSWRDD